MLKPIAVIFLLHSAVRCQFLILEKRGDPPAGFSRIGPTPVDQVLNLRLALTQGNITGLQDTIYEISTPGNPRYGQYLTQDEVNHFVAPSEGTTSLVTSWLDSNGLTSSPITPAGDWISVNLTVSKANEVLGADFSTFQNEDTNQTVVRTLAYSIPTSLKADISWIHPTVNFPSARGLGSPSVQNITSRATSATPPISSISADCRESSSWTPVCFQELYGILSAPAKPAANVLAVSGFENNFANERDLATFLETFRPDMSPNTTFELISVDGGINNQLPAGSGIAALCLAPDIQYTVGLATGVSVTFISTGTIPNDFYTEMLDQAHNLLSMTNPPQTVLNTWGSLESQVSPQIAISLCNVYAQLAARGVSYIVETGLWGAGGIPFDTDCVPFDPPFPATLMPLDFRSSVTAVGATEFTTDETQETASSMSGGGFSNFFQRPKYQDAAVDGYLRLTGNTESTAFNVSSRAVPDVSAISQVEFILDGEDINFFGSTAYSAEIFASIVALLTNERIAAGKPALGFLNPLLYQNPSAFNDMQVGNNPGCNTDGFNATAGWDPVTGFGSPIYPKLQEACNKF
ncbi:subtilisin-like protein [Mycena rosella]|uniref:Subtilisin-like protein n=1 Tax=Mycena rosella TaxID=1033263 RepID=A0AAD7DS43_MYCRO|nr:subtilisin-like protein [Mycena rosella]